MEIPKYVIDILEKLEKNNFEAYIVGGCVRDLILGRNINDWDITTNALPEEVLGVFPDGKYENIFGTVILPIKKKREIDLPVLTKDIKISKQDKKKAIDIAKNLLQEIKDEIHGIAHVERVVQNMIKIAENIKDVNVDILEIVGYFHDVGYIKFNEEAHVAGGQEIVKEELSGILNKDLVDLIAKLVFHKFSKTASSIEEQILKEADTIDGINVQRCNIIKNLGLTEHFEWVKNKYNEDNYYKMFLTENGVSLLSESINNFNNSGFDFKLKDVDKNLDVVEITTYRSEQGYSDRRHPDDIRFEKDLDKDLERRDFTINAMAVGRESQNVNRKTLLEGKEITIQDLRFTLHDLFGGEKDLKKRIIRAVGEPSERFKEDALRMMRAIRFLAQLNFEIEPKTERAIAKLAGNIRFISNERIRDELVKILQTEKAYEGVMKLYDTRLLQYILPELTLGVGVKQDRHHVYDVFKHNVLSLKYCPSKDWRVKFAALLHDIGKTKTRKIIDGIATFYNHEYVSAKLASKITKRLHFSNEDSDKVVNLVKNHMFYYNVGEVTAASVRRLIAKVGKENLKDLIDMRIADRLGSGVEKAKPYKLRHLEYMFERVQNDPVSVKMLKINGDDLIQTLKLAPGPKIGAILDVLLSEVIEDTELNNKDHLIKRSKELDKMNLEELRAKAKEVIEEKRSEDDEEMKKEFWVK